jgi:hypothetical protein
MNKFVKYSAITVVSVVGVGVIGTVALVTLVNPNRFKPLIEKSVYQSTGRNITLAGDISWKIYPNIGLTLRDVTLSNPSSDKIFTKDSNMLSLKSADVAVALIPLLSHKVELKTLNIDGLNVALIQKDGINNWTFTPPEQPNQPQSEAKEAEPIKFEMSGFSLTNSTIKYDNFDTNQHIDLPNTNLVIATGFGGHIKLDQKAQLVDLSKVSINYNDNFVGELNVTLNNFESPTFDTNVNITKFKANDILNQLHIADAERKNLKLIDNVVISGQVKGDMKDVDVKDFKFNLSDTIKGDINVAVKNIKDPTYKGSLDLEPFNLNSALDQLNIAVKDRKDKPLLNNFAIKSDGFSGDTKNIQINKLDLTLGSQFTTSLNNLKVTNFANPTISGGISIPQTNLNNVLDGLNIAKTERKGKTALNTFAFSAKSFNATTSNVKLNTADVTIGTFKMHSNNLAVNNIKNPSYSGDFNIAELNLNQFLDSMNIAVAERKDKPLLNKFSASSSSFSGTVNSINLNNFKLSLGDIFAPSFSKLSVNNFAKPVVSGHINLPNFSANKVMPQLGMAVPDIKNKAILDNISLDTDFNATTNSAKLTNLKTNIDKTNVTGSLDVSSFKPLVLANNVNLNQLDVSNFSDVNGYKVPMKQLQFAGNIKMNEKMEIASLTGKQSISIGNITVQGLDTTALIMQLHNTINNAGNGNKDIITTAINASNTLHAVNNMKAQIQAATKPGNRNYAQTTNLGAFKANVIITNGLINPSNISLTGGGVADITGSGSANLAGNKKIEYSTTSKVTVKGINKVFETLTFPAKITGTIDDPSASLDWVSIQQQIGKYLIEQNKAQVQSAVKQQINKAVGQQINNAIGQQNGNQATDAVSKGVTNAIGKLFGG